MILYLYTIHTTHSRFGSTSKKLTGSRQDAGYAFASRARALSWAWLKKGYTSPDRTVP
jgi:hypothetical protein